jgi:hypothetical protein
MKAHTLLIVAVLAACSREDPRVSPTPTPTPIVPVPADAAPVPVGPLVELLHHTPSVVAVSSVVLNPKFQPEALVDGDLKTAWNSRTGDLVGSWIAFRVPAAAHVTAIKLTTGFESSGPEGDYFTQNHRLRHVRVTHAGKLVADAELDPDKRGLQPIAVDAAGGDFRIEIVALAPGRNKAWRETCVSELEVWGRAAAASPSSKSPVVKIGSLDGTTHDPMAGPFPSIESFCAMWRKPIDDNRAVERAKCDRLGGGDSQCNMLPGGDGSCDPQETLVSPSAAFLDARVVVLNDGDAFDGNFPCALFVRTRTGWFPTEQVACTGGEGTNVTFSTVELAIHDGELRWHYTADRDVTGTHTAEDVTVACSIDADGAPSCASTDTAP